MSNYADEDGHHSHSSDKEDQVEGGEVEGSGELETTSAHMAEVVMGFVRRTMKGQESGLYKVFAPRGMGPMLATPAATNMLLGAVVSYLNGCYKSLILQDDQYVIDSFAEMKAASLKGKHSEVCLLNIIMALIQNFHRLIDRTAYNISSYDAYMGSFEAEFNRVYDLVAAEVQGLFRHECHGNIDLSKEDPNAPLFTIHEQQGE